MPENYTGVHFQDTKIFIPTGLIFPLYLLLLIGFDLIANLTFLKAGLFPTYITEIDCF